MSELRTVILNPPAATGERFIREGRCMQSVDSWAAIWPPLTLAYLAAIGREFGPVDLFDANVEEELTVEVAVNRVKEFKADIIVVNTAFPSIEFDGEIARLLKEACPGAIVLGFGVFFTLLEADSMKACPAFDVGIVGEVEATFKELLERRRDGKDLAGCNGLMWRRGDDIVVEDRRELIKDLDTLPRPARDLLHNERYLLPNNGRPFTLINAARGCPYKCIFCIAPIYYGRGLRRHSLQYILDEIEHCMKEYGLKDFLMWEEIFTLDKEFGVKFCDAIIEKGWDISWAATTRADALEEGLLRKMKESGLFLLGLGIESGSQEILDAANKNEKVEEVKKGVDLCHKVGVKTMGHFIFGLPGETEETAERTIEYALSLGLDYLQCYVAVPYPRTPLGELAKEKGWIVSERWSEFDFGGASVMKTDELTPEQVNAFRDKLFKKFYFRPWYMLGKVGTLLRRPQQILQASKFINWILRRK